MGDEDVVTLLNEWNLSQYISVFKENAITSMSLALLGDTEIKELIPLIGHRAIFTRNLEEWRKVMHPAASSTPSPTVDSSQPLSEVSFLSDILNLQSDGSEKTESKSISQNVEYAPQDTTQDYIVIQQSLQGIEDLKQLLESSNDGKGLLALDKSIPLDNAARIRLVRIVCTHILKDNPSRNIVSAVYGKWAHEIVCLFPQEKRSVYFHNKFVDTGRGVVNRLGGKLPDQIHNLKRRYRVDGLIPKRSRSSSSSPRSFSPSSPLIQPPPGETVVEEDSEDLQWLKNSSEPWVMVEEKWRLTISARLRLCNSCTIDEYFQNFPALQKSTGYTLLVKDFDRTYPNNTDGLYTNFPLIKEKIIHHGRKRAARDKEIDKLPGCLNSSEETTNIVSLLLIPYLLSVSSIRLKGCNKKVWRPSKAEVRDGFVTHVTSDAEIRQIIGERRNKFAGFGLTLQPFVIIVGPSLLEIRSCLVIVNNTTYVLPNILSAVDVCFKIMWVINAQYPVESLSTWLFIQKAFYKLNKPCDKESTAVNTLLGELGIVD